MTIALKGFPLTNCTHWFQPLKPWVDNDAKEPMIEEGGSRRNQGLVEVIDCPTQLISVLVIWYLFEILFYLIELMMTRKRL